MKLLKKCLCMILVLSVLLSISVSSIGHVDAVSASDFISESYASNVIIWIDRATSLMSYPTNETAYFRYSIPKDTVLNAKGLHKDTSGNYWYEVIYYNMTLYVDAGAGRMVEHVTGDITFKDEQSPTNLAINQGFPIKGKINSVYNKLGTVTAAMYYGSDLSRNPALSSSDNVNGKSYTLDSSTVDYYLHFNKLSAGVYTYAVTVEALSYYIDNGSLKESVRNIVLTSNICSVIDSSNPLPSLHEGIDVSVWNGDIDWAKVATQTEFVIIRASWECTEDERFDINAQGCRDNNIPFGVYVYSYAETVQEAINEANAVLNIVSNYDLALPIYFDWEDSVCVNLPASTQAEIVKAFCDTIRAAGRQPGLYTYTWLIPSTFSDSYFNTLPIWVAHYGVSYHGYNGGVHMWQYSCTGTIDGISGSVDMNHMYVELPGENSSDTSYLSQCDYYPSNVMIKTTAQTNMREYPASGYSLMETIPADTSLHATGLYRNTYGNLWYQVEKDGVTGYVGADTVTTTEHLFDDISVINPDMASNLAVGKGYYIGGEISSIYNELSTVRTKVYPAEDIAGTPVIESSYSPHTKEYSLYKSEVDYGLLFGTVPEGYYTYEISVDVDNYYAQDFTTLATKTKNVTLWEKPYTVGDAGITPPPSEDCTHELVIEPAVAPTCTQSGLTEGSYCSKCGIEFSAQTTIEPKGHNYVSEFFAGTCQEYAYNVFTCSECSDSYKEFVGGALTDWQETKPEGVPDELLETKTQYRKSEYQTIKNYETSVDGYTLVNREWESQGQKTQECVKSWPAGFSTSNSLYTKYNNTPKQDYTDTYYNKTEVNSEEIIGYLYYHWCAGRVIGGGPYNSLTSITQTSTYSAFHAFFSTEDPSTKTTASDSSVTIPNASCCTDSWWYYNVPVYKQTYTDYKALYTHSIWTAWSEWSDTEYVEAWNRNVETRTLYRYVAGGQLGNHNYVSGSCTICGEKNPNGDMYLFGYINGADYADKADAENMGIYKFVDGKLNVKFTQDSYVGVKSEGNTSWYMTDGYQGQVTSVTLYNTTALGDKADKLFVPGGRDVEFTLVDNGNDTFTLSYYAELCEHIKHNSDGVCTSCGEAVEHNYSDGLCVICGKACNHSFTDGVCTVCGAVCEHIYADGECTICHITCEHSFEDGECTICHKACEHSFKEGECTICHKACQHNWQNGKCIICEDECEHSFKDGKCTICGIDCVHNWVNGTCSVCAKECDHNFADGRCTVCGTDCDHQWTEGTCGICGKVCENHSYSEGFCVICGKAEPVYYLFGYINGGDYACEDDYMNTGEYQFVDGTLTATFTENSYVAVKTGDNANWYMTNGYPGDNVNLTVLYNTTLLGDKSNKLFVPKGREVTFTLVDNGNDSFTLSYTAKPCEHSDHNPDGTCTLCGVNVDHTFKNGSCTGCGLSCEHIFKSGICITCGYKCSHSWVDGKCNICGYECRHKWADGACYVCGYECQHSFNNGLCEICYTPCEHSFVNGVCSVCTQACEHSFMLGECINCGVACEHSWVDGKCRICNLSCEHSFANGNCTACGKECEHSFKDGKCTNCGIACSHNWSEGKCTVCNTWCQHSISMGECTVCHKSYQYYLAGYINGSNTGCEENYALTGDYLFVNGSLKLNVTEDSYVFVKSDDNENWYMADSSDSNTVTLYNTNSADACEMMLIPAGTEVTLTLEGSEADTFTLSYAIDKCNHVNHGTDGKCTLCGDIAEHTYVSGTCTVCGEHKPEKNMYLFGFINGGDYACEGDYENIGIYKFVDGRLTATFTENSYVAVKTEDNSDWYMTDGYLGESTTSATLYNTAEGIDADKLFVPGGTEVTFNLINNGDDTFTLSYVAVKLAQPEINLKYTSLSYEEEVKYSVYFTAENLEDVALADMGLAIFDFNDSDGTVETATELVSDVALDGKYLKANTKEIYPQKYGDTVYFKVYAKLSDGSYIYSDILSYSVVHYAQTVLNNPRSSATEKALVVSMLNYGAEMQKHFGYKTDKLMNATLTPEQKAYAASYNGAMADKATPADAEKLGEFKKNGSGTMLYPSAVLDRDSFSIRYNFKSNKAACDEVKLYCWDSPTYNNVSQLTEDNAVVAVNMYGAECGYDMILTKIAAKDLDDTIYVTVVYKSGENTYCTGVTAYSVAEYFKLYADNAKSDLQSLAQAAIVYGYYAKCFFKG